LKNNVKTLGLVSALALSSLASAASATESLRVRVPFSFVFAGQEFTSGDYNIQETESGLVFLEGSKGGAAALSVPEGIGKPGSATGLRFTKEGNAEYLVGVQIEGDLCRSIPFHASQARKLTMAASQ